MLRKKRGQSTLEYVMVFAAVVAALIIVVYTKMKPSVESVVDAAATKMDTAAAAFNE